MEDHTLNSPKQWISIANHSQPEEETDDQKTNTPPQPQSHNKTKNR